jgi:hypothetical protein
MANLQLEFNANFQRANDTFRSPEGWGLTITPPLDEDYWLFRVKLYEDQAILGFPKFHTIGIGFAQEEDWNTNLPYTCDAEQIYDHIKHNKEYEQITDEQCLEAIQLVQKAAKLLKESRGEV